MHGRDIECKHHVDRQYVFSQAGSYAAPCNLVAGVEHIQSLDDEYRDTFSELGCLKSIAAGICWYAFAELRTHCQGQNSFSEGEQTYSDIGQREDAVAIDLEVISKQSRGGRVELFRVLAGLSEKVSVVVDDALGNAIDRHISSPLHIMCRVCDLGAVARLRLVRLWCVLNRLIVRYGFVERQRSEGKGKEEC